MKIKRPSPAMVVALVALVSGTTGTAVAQFVNADAVDGKSAVADGATLSQAAGRLVATQRSGPARGRVRAKYLDLSGVVRGGSSAFGQSVSVQDNQTLVPANIGSVPGIGSVTASCADENQRAGTLDPSTTLTFANTSGDTVNIARTIGFGGPAIEALPNGAQSTFAIRGSNTFQLHLERKGTNYVVSGVVRQDGRGTTSAACLTYGYALVIPSK